MPSSGPRRSLIATRVDVVAAVVMAVILLSACAVAAVLSLGHGNGTAAGDIGTSRAPVPGAGAGRSAMPGHSATPAPARRTASAGQSTPLKPSVPAVVSYDSTGPSSAGAMVNHASTLSWPVSVSGTDTALLVAVAVGQQNDSGLSASATVNGDAMVSLARVHDNGHPDGFLEVFGLAGVQDGTAAIRIAVTGGPATELTGGSEAFSGARPEGTFSAPAVAAGAGTTPAVTIASKPGGLIAAFAACGSPITGTTAPAVRRFVADDSDNTGAGNSAGATLAATGSDVTASWSSLQDWWGAVAVQVNR
jgi:hypothetical protein